MINYKLFLIFLLLLLLSAGATQDVDTNSVNAVDTTQEEKPEPIDFGINGPLTVDTKFNQPQNNLEKTEYPIGQLPEPPNKLALKIKYLAIIIGILGAYDFAARIDAWIDVSRLNDDIEDYNNSLRGGSEKQKEFKPSPIFYAGFALDFALITTSFTVLGVGKDKKKPQKKKVKKKVKRKTVTKKTKREKSYDYGHY